MLEHNYARAIAMCAPGKRVTVTFASGKSLTLPIVPEPAPVPPPHPLEVLSKHLLESDAAAREEAARTEESMVAMKEAVDGLAAGIADGVREIVGTLHLPVVPTKYDKDGRIAEARRKGAP